jgi:hypothetical protein
MLAAAQRTKVPLKPQGEDAPIDTLQILIRCL